MSMDDQNAERLSRQAAIETLPNPNTALDYLSRQDSEIGGTSTIKVRLCYVPGKLVISSEAFGQYLHSINVSGDLPLEGLAHIILDDLNNELVPRWIQILLIANDHGLDRGHKILIEDREPNWNNPNLLGRVAPF